jgi:hypothetical protein
MRRSTRHGMLGMVIPSDGIKLNWLTSLQATSCKSENVARDVKGLRTGRRLPQAISDTGPLAVFCHSVLLVHHHHLQDMVSGGPYPVSCYRLLSGPRGEQAIWSCWADNHIKADQMSQHSSRTSPECITSWSCSCVDADHNPSMHSDSRSTHSVPRR